MPKRNIILVDVTDRPIGIGEKMKVHQEGKLHRAFSVFIFNSQRELLLQKRAKEKYHSGGLWTNTCCSHPRPRKDIKKEAQKRLKEEMGIKADLKEVFNFIYKAKIDDLIEYEFDHVLVGTLDGMPKINKKEAENWQWIKLKDLGKDIKKNPQKYTYWLRLIVANFKNKLKVLVGS